MVQSISVCLGRRGVWVRVRQTIVGFELLVVAALGQMSLPNAMAQILSPARIPKLTHRAIVLRDEAGQSVLKTGKPISARQTCGGNCHNYDFIINSFYFQQGKNEIAKSINACRDLEDVFTQSARGARYDP